MRVEKESFHASEPDEIETTVHTPPKDFGLIDVTEFNPEEAGLTRLRVVTYKNHA